MEYECDKCKNKFNLPEGGILAEIHNNKIVVNGCNPFVKLTCLCNNCKKELNIKN